jgi:hypothetical protein
MTDSPAAASIAPHLLIVGVDPSSSRTGFAVLKVSTGGEELLERGSIRMMQSWALERKLANLAREFAELVDAVVRDHGRIDAAGVETPTPRGNRNVNRAGLFAWARAVGVVEAVLAVKGVDVIPAGVDRWARATKKEDRAANIARRFPAYDVASDRGKPSDRGLDEADAIGVGLYIAREVRKGAIVNGGDVRRALGALCATTSDPTRSRRPPRAPKRPQALVG